MRIAWGSKESGILESEKSNRHLICNTLNSCSFVFNGGSSGTDASLELDDLVQDGHMGIMEADTTAHRPVDRRTFLSYETTIFPI